MPIRYYEGIEGSHKTSMMTRDLTLHYKSGGQVLTFPGYDLLDGKGNVISQTLLPEQWVTLPPELKRKRIVIAIDEVKSFFNNHNWFNRMCDMMSDMMAQRRKFEMGILMTGPIYDRLPPVIKEMVHELVHCRDRHTLNHSYERGASCLYWKEDLRGLLSTPQHHRSKRKIFYSKPWWKHYDTYQAVDPMNQFMKVRFKGREIIVNANGEIYNADTVIPNQVDKWDWLTNTINGLKKKGITEIEPWHLSSMIGKPLNTTVKGWLRLHGVHWNSSSQCYVLE